MSRLLRSRPLMVWLLSALAGWSCMTFGCGVNRRRVTVWKLVLEISLLGLWNLVPRFGAISAHHARQWFPGHRGSLASGVVVWAPVRLAVARGPLLVAECASGRSAARDRSRPSVLVWMPFREIPAAAVAGQTSPAVAVVARPPPLVLAGCRRVVSCREIAACQEFSPRLANRRHAPGARHG